MKNIHIVPTEKSSRLFITDGKLFNYHKPQKGDGVKIINQNIYITSDEALPYDSSIFDSGAFYHRDPVGDVYIITKDTFKPNPHFCKRIILTTDQDLIKDGVQAIDDEFLEWFVKNPSCDSVDVVNDEYVDLEKDEYIDLYKIIIPKEESKQHFIDMMKDDEELGLYEEPKKETLEEAAERLYPIHIKSIIDKYDDGITNVIGEEDVNEDCRDSFIAGAKWQQERMYSEEEVIAIVEKSRETGLTAEYLLLTEQFKKK
jgi:hypothetical protein